MGEPKEETGEREEGAEEPASPLDRAWEEHWGQLLEMAEGVGGNALADLTNRERLLRSTFSAGWEAHRRDAPPPPPVMAPAPAFDASLPSEPGAGDLHRRRGRAIRELRPEDVVWVQPYALLEHRTSGQIWADPLFDTRQEESEDYSIQLTVLDDGSVVAKGPFNKHRITNDQPRKPGMRHVSRFETS